MYAIITFTTIFKKSHAFEHIFCIIMRIIDEEINNILLTSTPPFF